MVNLGRLTGVCLVLTHFWSCLWVPIWLNDFGYWLVSLVCMCNKHVCYTRVFMCVLRPEVDIGCLPQSLSALFCETQCLTEPGPHGFWLDSPRDLPVSASQAPDLEEHTAESSSLHQCWGSELRTLPLRQILYPWFICPAPWFFSFSFRGRILVSCLDLLDSSDPPASASRVAGMTDVSL